MFVLYHGQRDTDYYVGITCPERCWQSIRVYSNMRAYNGVATLSFYYYVWEIRRKASDIHLLPELTITGRIAVADPRGGGGARNRRAP